MKEPIAHSVELLHRIKEALTPNRLPLLIAIDGANGTGKSSLASWLAWQTGMPTVHLDLFLTSLHPIQWLTSDLKRVVDRRLDRKRPGPVIVEGVLVQDALDQIGRKADLLFSSWGIVATAYLIS
jgi:pantothenate kinase-related protein Tda10